MQLIGGKPVYSASDLVAYLACKRLTQLERAAMAKLLPRPRVFADDLDVLRERGLEHERRYRTELESQGKGLVEINDPGWDASSLDPLLTAAHATEQAMAQGWDVIYQGTLFDGIWRGKPDFLLRVNDSSQRSKFGPSHSEVADTKLARHARAGAVLQVCSYVDLLTSVQGVQPTLMSIVMGGNPRHEEK